MQADGTLHTHTHTISKTYSDVLGSASKENAWIHIYTEAGKDENTVHKKSVLNAETIKYSSF